MRATPLKVLLMGLCFLSNMGQARSVLAATDVWTNIGPEGGSITAMAIAPQTPSTLYAGPWGGGVFKSTNGGGN